MNKFKNNLTKFVQNNLSHDDQYDNIVKKINLQPNEKEDIIMKKRTFLRFVMPSIIGVLLIGTIIGVVLANRRAHVEKTDNPVAVVQIDVNPSISLVVSEHDIVLSIYGENDDGKMIIAGEELVGQSVNFVIEKIIELEVETGYLTDGENKKITVNIQATQGEYLTDLESKIKTKVEETCDEYKITETLEFVKQTTKNNLVERAIALDSTISVETLNEMSNQEILEYIAGCQLERINIPTKDIEEFYNNFKTQRIAIAEREATKNIINNLDSTYQTLKNGYQELYNSLATANDYLTDLYYNYFIVETSEYQKKLTAFKEEKIAIQVLKTEIENLPEDSVERITKMAQLLVKENVLVQTENALIYIKDAAYAAIDLAKQSVNNLLAEMDNFYNQLPAEIKTTLTNKALEVEEIINTTKDNALNVFETEYGELITSNLNNLKKSKEELINQLKSSK